MRGGADERAGDLAGLAVISLKAPEAAAAPSTAAGPHVRPGHAKLTG